MPYDPQRHHRRSIRLKGYDYTSPGAYFVTVCAATRGHVYGSVVDGDVVLNAIGKIIANAWRSLPKYFPYLSLDIYVLMPDHLHGIIMLHDGIPATIPMTGKARGTAPGSLPAVMQNFKAVSTRRVNQACRTAGQRLWQEDYYEHIVRDANDMERIRQYIATNP